MMKRWNHRRASSRLKLHEPRLTAIAPTTPTAYKPASALKSSCQRENENRKRNGGEQRKLRNAVAIQTRQLSRHLAVLRHHEDHADQRDDRGVHRAEKQKTENNSDYDSERRSKPGR